MANRNEAMAAREPADGLLALGLALRPGQRRWRRPALLGCLPFLALRQMGQAEAAAAGRGRALDMPWPTPRWLAWPLYGPQAGRDREALPARLEPGVPTTPAGSRAVSGPALPAAAHTVYRFERHTTITLLPGRAWLVAGRPSHTAGAAWPLPVAARRSGLPIVGAAPQATSAAPGARPGAAAVASGGQGSSSRAPDLPAGGLAAGRGYSPPDAGRPAGSSPPGQSRAAQPEAAWPAPVLDAPPRLPILALSWLTRPLAGRAVGESGRPLYALPWLPARAAGRGAGLLSSSVLPLPGQRGAAPQPVGPLPGGDDMPLPARDPFFAREPLPAREPLFGLEPSAGPPRVVRAPGTAQTLAALAGVVERVVKRQVELEVQRQRDALPVPAPTPAPPDPGAISAVLTRDENVRLLMKKISSLAQEDRFRSGRLG